MRQVAQQIVYRELHGCLEPGASGAAAVSAELATDAVVLSNLEHGSFSSAGVRGLSIRYVARGCEDYRINGRGYRIEAGQVMIAPHENGAECDIRKVERTGTLGLCTLVRDATDDFEWAFGPQIFAADCTPFGSMVNKTAVALWKASGPKQVHAQQLVACLRAELPAVVHTLSAQAAAVEGAKPATRFEMVRRANLAQAYLHSVSNRPVGLNELSAAVGLSPFRLLAAFHQCFGETPAVYHRKLRLNLVLAEVRRRRMPVSSISEEFGFAGASSFSHAYRRAFGHAPMWNKDD